MKYLFTLFFILFTILGCGTTTRLKVEVRVDRSSPPIERFHLVQKVSIASSELNPAMIKQDKKYKYYSFRALLHKTTRGFFVVDIASQDDTPKKVEAYDLYRNNIKVRKDWSNWLSPNFTGKDNDWISFDYWILNNMDEASQKDDEEKKISKIRYKLEYREP